ncbi:MAG TPA: methyltransferase [Paraburkholderia sp.]
MASPAHARIEIALGDRSRPRRDRARDVRDHTAGVLNFIGIATGDRIVDFLPFRGYFTRLFASLVGDSGCVFATIPAECTRIERIENGRREVEQFAREKHNVVMLAGSAEAAGSPPGEIDVFFIALNYHDLHAPLMGPVNIRMFNEAVFRALKPGGRYVIVDHAACPDASTSAPQTLHRIDPEVVRREVEAAGFEYSGEHDALRNPHDGHASSVFARGVRYRTDRFVMKLRKPAAASPAYPLKHTRRKTE